MNELISRKAAIDALEWKWAGKAAIDAIKNLPSAQTERKRGRWVKQTDENCWWYECSECGDYPMKNAYGHEELSAYCPHCGAKMVGGEEDVDAL